MDILFLYSIATHPRAHTPNRGKYPLPPPPSQTNRICRLLTRLPATEHLLRTSVPSLPLHPSGDVPCALVLFFLRNANGLTLRIVPLPSLCFPFAPRMP